MVPRISRRTSSTFFVAGFRRFAEIETRVWPTLRGLWPAACHGVQVSICAYTLHPLNSRIERAHQRRRNDDSAYIFMSVPRRPVTSVARVPSCHDFPGTFNRGICMGNGAKSALVSSMERRRLGGVACEYHEKREEKKGRKKKGGPDVRRAGVFVEYVPGSQDRTNMP